MTIEELYDDIFLVVAVILVLSIMIAVAALTAALRE